MTLAGAAGRPGAAVPVGADAGPLHRHIHLERARGPRAAVRLHAVHLRPEGRCGTRCNASSWYPSHAAPQLAESRRPKPAVLKFKEGSSMARWLQCRLIPLHKVPVSEPASSGALLR